MLNPTGLHDIARHMVVHPEGELGILYAHQEIEEILWRNEMNITWVGDYVSMMLNSEISRNTLTPVMLLLLSFILILARLP